MTEMTDQRSQVRSSPEALAELRRRLRAIRREVFAPRPQLVRDDEPKPDPELKD